jgi:predicted metal-dependent phosphoesterase TrpH
MMEDMLPDVWSKADLHIHSRHSDGLASIPQIMEHVATKTDLSVIAITDHNTLEGSLFAKSLEDMYPGLEVVVGEEISSSWGHVIGLYLEEAIPPRMNGIETVAAINEQGGVAIIPHPFANRAFGRWGLQSVGARIGEMAFQAVEVYNSSPYLVYANRVAAKALAGGQGWAATGGSDAHVLRAIGTGYTRFRGKTAQDLRHSLEELETTACADRGRMSVAVRYMVRARQLRRQQVRNWERCKA